MVVDDEEKANILNTFFSTVFTVENEMLGEIPRNNENPILRVTNLTQEEVRNRLNKIKIDKSPGPDGIHPRVLRELTKGSGSLTVLPKNTAMNKEWYQNVLQEQLLPTVQEQFGAQQCLFQHYGAPCHKAKTHTVNEPVAETPEAAEQPYEVAGVTRNKIMTAQFECYQKIMQEPMHTKEGRICNRTWDGWLCWGDAVAGDVSEQHCPDYFQDFDPSEKVTKHCDTSGYWFRHPDSNRTWTNYTQCNAFTRERVKVGNA
ncbi:unnamed protein product [Ranitomeya imitator]|uniref:Calcitonin gene-related peptide type 1 receptor n=1 Tax=Ranitomeya imitator TaxID=111125 RepID=A0ABN9LXR2_9NEOB|nr:unnamed protein product [Ranitomeya imitator]